LLRAFQNPAAQEMACIHAQEKSAHSDTSGTCIVVAQSFLHNDENWAQNIIHTMRDERSAFTTNTYASVYFFIFPFASIVEVVWEFRSAKLQFACECESHFSKYMRWNKLLASFRTNCIPHHSTSTQRGANKRQNEWCRCRSVEKIWHWTNEDAEFAHRRENANSRAKTAKFALAASAQHQNRTNMRARLFLFGKGWNSSETRTVCSACELKWISLFVYGRVGNICSKNNLSICCFLYKEAGC
jgi:hypothetical protein